jgi:hypothetical protein
MLNSVSPAGQQHSWAKSWVILLEVLPLTEITTVAVAFRLGSPAWSSDSSCSSQSNHSRGSLESPTPVGKCVLIAFG